MCMHTHAHANAVARLFQLPAILTRKPPCFFRPGVPRCCAVAAVTDTSYNVTSAAPSTSLPSWWATDQRCAV